MTRVTFAPAARVEAREARAYYAAISIRLAERFTQAFDAAVTRVRDDPVLWSPVSKRFRRCLFDRFPYALIYEIDGDQVRVLAVMHQSRRPSYWRNR